MKKEDTLFWFLRTLVRQGELRPAYARQIYLRHMESSGKEIPFGHALWLNRGWAYDGVVWGSKKAAEDNTYCPVSELPSIPGYDRRAGKAKIFGTDAAPSAPLWISVKFCEVCGKRLVVTEIDKAEGIITAWFCCPEFLEGNDEHDSFQVKFTQAVYEEFLEQQG